MPVCELVDQGEKHERHRRRRTTDVKRTRGHYEHPKGSGVWWVCYFDEGGRRHREKVGPKGLALKVYQKRKNEVQERRFFPERISRRDVLLGDLIDDYLSRDGDHRPFGLTDRLSQAGLLVVRQVANARSLGRRSIEVFAVATDTEWTRVD